eukprot:CAMPEP_0198725338 /NCGR_PEP_ID=MMETSP1475-20131203/2660_1 /TAXON_ID= ORGANISM="Unidentified sp., Strain CCMP1999" /NCGR_SAMPLE_ID=MMETSP1475 /ASSEMBLY_ACC=CAM_ASM_001111 /LENGTH=131 /DNA_ID=CAMNT_0044487093 /DNA_START=209 /DNA_END=604 /DNA_ORIENTATION=-
MAEQAFSRRLKYFDVGASKVLPVTFQTAFGISSKGMDTLVSRCEDAITEWIAKREIHLLAGDDQRTSESRRVGDYLMTMWTVTSAVKHYLLKHDSQGENEDYYGCRRATNVTLHVILEKAESYEQLDFQKA